MPSKSPDKNIEDFRYDAKLFKQAYNAGLKAKKIEKEAKRKRNTIVFVCVLSVLLVLTATVYLVRSGIFQRPTFIKTQDESQVFVKVIEKYEPGEYEKEVYEEDLVDSKAALYADLNNGGIQYIKNSQEQLPIASITKLMSALVVLNNYELEEEVEVKRDWYDEEDMSWSLGLDKGDNATVETLLKAMLISSYNDAAYVLAQHMEGGLEAFVESMNDYAEQLGLIDTQFNNPSGLDSNGGNISTIEDLYRLATVVYRNDFIMDTLTKSYADLKWDIGEDRIYTTNALMGQYGNIAGKTGYTELSGGCFLGITQEGKLTIILGSEERFEDTEKLLIEL
jgi:D-alanyl-D-alanine carboxypeptidase